MTITIRFLTAIVLALSLCLLAGAQAGSPPQQQKQGELGTKMEGFLGKRGNIVVKDIYKVGNVSSLGSAKMDALVIYEPGSSQKIKGLRVEVTEPGRLERSNVSFIDFDELQSLSEALSYMSNLAGTWKGQSHYPYTEVTYVSKGEFKVGFFQDGVRTGVFVTSGLIGTVTAYLNVADLERMRTSVDQASMELKSH